MSGAPVTDLAGLGAAWESVGPSIERRLRRGGMDADTAADTAQEVACRAAARVVAGAGFTSRHGLLAWSHETARNLAVDAWRRERTAERHVPLEPAGDEFEVVEWRDLLRRTLAAMDTLTPAQRAALTALLGGRFPDDKRDQVRESVQRLRARERLRRIVGRLPVLWPPRWWRLGWLAVPVAAGVVAGTPTPGGTRVRTSTTAPEAVHASAHRDHPAREAPPDRPATAPTPPSATPTTAVAGAAAGGERHREDRVPLVTMAPPTGSEVEIGTRPDTGRYVLCVEAAVGAVCVDKPLRTLGPSDEAGR